MEQYFRQTSSIDRNSEGSRWIRPLWRIRRGMNIPQVNGPVGAFCGIARPEQFFKGLEAAGVRLVLRKAFADHHRYTARDVESLAAQARAGGASTLITTEKDEVRLGELATRLPSEIALKAVQLDITIEDEPCVTAWLEERLGSSQKQQISG